MLLFTWALLFVDGRSTGLNGRQILLFQLKLDCRISISRCGSFIRERWIFIPMAPVKCGPSQLASAPSCHRRIDLCEAGSIRCRASIPTRLEQATLQRFANAGGDVRASWPSRSIVLCYRPDPQV